MPAPDETLNDLAAADAAQIEEYKLLQGKLDKIGEFRFHVKNWAFTLTLGILAGGVTARANPWGIFVAALVPAAAFWGLERRQHQLADVFGKRAILLEGVAAENATARAERLTALGRQVPNFAPIRIAYSIGEAQPEGRLPFWKKPDNWAYVSMVFLAALAASAAALRGTDNTQQLAGKLSVDVASSAAQFRLDRCCKAPFAPTAPNPANIPPTTPPLYDAQGNKLP